MLEECLQISRRTWQGRDLEELDPLVLSHSILPVKGKQMALRTPKCKMVQNVSRIRLFKSSKCPDRRKNIMFAFHPWVFLHFRSFMSIVWSLPLCCSDERHWTSQLILLFASWSGTHQENNAKGHRGWTNRYSGTSHHMYPFKTPNVEYWWRVIRSQESFASWFLWSV